MAIYNSKNKAYDEMNLRCKVRFFNHKKNFILYENVLMREELNIFE